MHIGEAKKLNGWLILLMVLLIIGSLGAASREITDIRRLYEPHFPQYPSLKTAVLIYQYILFASVCTALYVAWLLWKRIPDTLLQIKCSFVATVVLRIIAPWAFWGFAGLPNDTGETTRGMLTGSFLMSGIGAAWLLYLYRSKHVRDLYGG
jgi:hypothetical protein